MTCFPLLSNHLLDETYRDIVIEDVGHSLLFVSFFVLIFEHM